MCAMLFSSVLNAVAVLFVCRDCLIVLHNSLSSKGWCGWMSLELARLKREWSVCSEVRSEGRPDDCEDEWLEEGLS